MVNHDLGAKNGQRIRLEKVLLIGAKDFTLFGRPFLPRDLVNIEATIVEKSLSHKKINFYARGKREVKYCKCKKIRAQWIITAIKPLYCSFQRLHDDIEDQQDQPAQAH